MAEEQTGRGPRYWWVNQQRFEERRHLKCLWAPLEGAGGRRVHHWESLSQAQVGDVVFSYADQSIKAVSKVTAAPFQSVYPTSDDGELGWNLAVEYTLLEEPVAKSVFIDHPGLPINKSGRANQVYFVPLSDEAGKYLLSLTGLEMTSVVPQAPAGKRNPPWRREELILALDYYLSHPLSEHGAGHPGIIELSEVLNKLPFPDAGRSPDACEMKLCNFRAFDPNYDGKGLDAGSKLDQRVWDEFYGDQVRLHREAETIRALVSNPEALAEVTLPQDGEEEFEEGALRYRMHRARERNSALVEKAKKTWQAKDPLLRCKCCGFSFKERYGVDFIEAHHRKPISELDGVTKTKVEDLMPVCANCHRMLHRGVSQLQQLMI